MRRGLGWVLAAAATLPLVAAGCGGSGSASSSSAPADTAAATTTEQAASGPATCNGEQMKFQLSFFPNAQHVGYLVAANRGLFEKEGLEVKMIPGGPTVNPALQVAQGNVDIAQLDFAEALNAKASGADIKWVAQTYQQDPLRYVSLKDVPLADPSALKGKTVGTQQTGELQAELTGLLKSAGLSRSDVELKSISFDVGPLMSHKIDIFPLQVFFHISQLQDAGVAYPDGVNVLDPNQYDAGVATQGLAVNGDFFSAHPEAVECFLRASVAGWQAAIDDPKGALADVKAYQPKGIASDKDTKNNIAETLKLVTTNAAGDPVEKPLSIDTAYLEESAKRLKEFGLVKDDDITGLVDTGPIQAAQAAAGS